MALYWLFSTEYHVIGFDINGIRGEEMIARCDWELCLWAFESVVENDEVIDEKDSGEVA